MTTAIMSKQQTKRAHKRGGSYKLVFKPTEYKGKLISHNMDWENGPLLPWKNCTLSRCYYLINNPRGALHGKVVWAAIYNQNKPDDFPVAVYTTDRKWNNDVTKQYQGQKQEENE